MNSRPQTLFSVLWGTGGVLLVSAAAVLVFWPKVQEPTVNVLRARPPQPTLRQPQDDANRSAYQQFWLEDQASAYARRLEVAPPENKPALEALLKKTHEDLDALKIDHIKTHHDGAKLLPTRANSN